MKVIKFPYEGENHYIAPNDAEPVADPAYARKFAARVDAEVFLSDWPELTRRIIRPEIVDFFHEGHDAVQRTA